MVAGWCFPPELPAQVEFQGNSFQEIYKRDYPGIQYSYDSEKQVHSYGNNWDLDKDGKKDQVWFVGTGGAHLYFFLRVELSSSGKTHSFPFLELDYPRLDPGVKAKGNSPDSLAFNFPFFIIQSTKNADIGIGVRLDNQTFIANQKELKKRGIKSPVVVLSFIKGVQFSDINSW